MASRHPSLVGAALLLAGCTGHREVPVYSTIPAFELTDQAGKPFGSKELAGQVWVASVIFTRCPDVCPMITARMFRLQQAAKERGIPLRLVSFSTDPAFDTPPVLAEYAKAHTADPAVWSFLTGKPELVNPLIVKGLKIAAGPVDSEGSSAKIVHGLHLVLVDKELRIRGFYPSNIESSVEDILRDAGSIARKPGG